MFSMFTKRAKQINSITVAMMCCGITAMAAEEGSKAAEEQELAPEQQSELEVQVEGKEDPSSWQSLKTRAKMAVKKLEAPAISGSLASKYRFRMTESQRDQDLFETLFLTAKSGDRFRFKMYGRATADLDTHGDRSGAYAFDSVSDTWGSSVHGELYYAEADYYIRNGVDKVSAGRLNLIDPPERVWVDGVLVESEKHGKYKVASGAYGGKPVHLNEASPENDWVYGLWAEGKPLSNLRVRLDWVHLEDDPDADGSMAAKKNDLYGSRVWYFCKQAFFFGQLNGLEGELKDARVSADYRDFEKDLYAGMSLYSLLETEEKDLAREYDPFTSSMHALHPYVTGRGWVSKGFGEDLIVDAGLDIRRVVDEEDKGTYNREYDRFYVAPTYLMPDLFLDVSASFEYWSSEEDVFSLGADATWSPYTKMKAMAGTYFSYFKYDYITDEEKEMVQTYFLKLESKPNDKAKIRLGYEFENDEYQDYHEINAELIWRF